MNYIREKLFISKILLVVFIPFLLNSLSACAIHYKNVPDNDNISLHYSVPTKVQYKIKRLPFLASNGVEAIVKAFESSDVFKDAERYFENDIPQQGTFISVETKYQAPDLSAMAFGYISLATLTILPAWSNHDGFNIYYRIYQEGQLVKTIHYESRRFLATWILLLPLAWINLLTDDQDDVYYAMTYQFLNEARPYLLR